MRFVEHGELKSMYENASKEHYKKSGRFLFKEAIPGETILTIVAGKLETLKEANLGETVVRNISMGSSAETYIIGGEKFKERYEPEDRHYIIEGHRWQVAHAIGEAMAFEYQGEPIKFKASWGEEMTCEEGDYIASPCDSQGNIQDADDIYRIEKDTFYQTYKKK